MRTALVCACVTVALAAVCAQAQSFTRWRHDAAGAFTITFDDNSLKQLTVVRPILNARGVRATWCVPTGGSGLPNLTLLRQAVSEGHEVASHSITHADLTLLDSSAADYELRRSKAIIDSLIPSQQCVSFAYPYCTVNDMLARMAARLYVVSRTCGGVTTNPPAPGDMQRIVGTGYGSADVYGPSLTSSVLNGYVNQAMQTRGWMVTFCHEFDGSGTGWVSSDTFAVHVDYIASRGERLYCATLGEISRYIQQRRCATIRLKSDNGATRAYELTDTLSNNSLYNLPLTMLLKLPSGWADASVTQNAAPCWSTVRNDTLVFEAVPDRGDILLSSTTAIAREHSGAAPKATVPHGTYLLDGRRATEPPRQQRRLTRVVR